MNEPSSYEKIHWRVFNIGAKIFAYGLVFVCLIFILLVTATIIGKPIGAEYPAWSLVLFLALLVVGVLMIKAKPYYPEEYKSRYEKRSK